MRGYYFFMKIKSNKIIIIIIIKLNLNNLNNFI